MTVPELMRIAPAREFLLSGFALKSFGVLADTYKFDKTRKGELLQLVDAYLDGSLPATEIPTVLTEAFGLSEGDAKKLAAETLGYGVLPLKVFVPQVVDDIAALGADVASYTVPEVSPEATTAKMLAERIAEASRLQLSEFLISRLALLVRQIASKEKTIEVFQTFLGRPVTIGGLGLVKSQIDDVMGRVEGLLKGVKVVEEEEYEAIRKGREETENREQEAEDADALPIVRETTSPSVILSQPAVRQALAKDLKEEVPRADVQKAQQLKGQAGEARKAFAAALADTLDAIGDILTAKNIDSELAAEKIGGALRGVRDIYQTRDVFERELKISGSDLTRVMAAVQRGLGAYHDAVGESDSLPEEEVEAIEEAEAVMLSRGRRPMAEPLRAELTVGSVPPAALGRITDVVPAAKLTGPVEQLRVMTVQQFRRLAPNPVDATRKVEELLRSLELISFEERVKGVKAWHESGVYALYTRMTNEALQKGVGISQVASERRNRREESFSPVEMKALMDLHERLRF